MTCVFTNDSSTSQVNLQTCLAELTNVAAQPEKLTEYFVGVQNLAKTELPPSLLLNVEKKFNPRINQVKLPPLTFTDMTETTLEQHFKRSGSIFKFIEKEAKIKENSIFLKIIACIPLVGIISSVINEYSLRKKINHSNENTCLFKLIDVKNHYKIASIIRELLSIALVISGVALSILCWPVGITIGVIAGSSVIFYSHGIHKNKAIINKLNGNDSSAVCMHVK